MRPGRSKGSSAYQHYVKPGVVASRSGKQAANCSQHEAQGWARVLLLLSKNNKVIKYKQGLV